MEPIELADASIEITTPESLTTDAAPSAPAPEAPPSEPLETGSADDAGVPDAPAPAAPAVDERVFELSDGTKITESELAQLKAGGMKDADYTRKTQEIAEEKRRLEAERAEFEKAKTAVREPEPNVVDPFKDPQRWQQIRAQQYVEMYRQEGKELDEAEIRRAVRDDYLEARQTLMYQQGEAQRAAEQARATERQVEQERRWLATTIDSHISKDEFKGINTEDGRDDVRAHLALTLQQKGEVTEADVQAAVAKVHGRWRAHVGQYVTKKQQVAASTGSVSRGGGQTPTRSKAPVSADLEGLRAIGRNLGGG